MRTWFWTCDFAQSAFRTAVAAFHGKDRSTEVHPLVSTDRRILRRIEGLLTYLIPHYIREGKVTCHCVRMYRREAPFGDAREAVKKSLGKRGFSAKVVHRDIDK